MDPARLYASIRTKLLSEWGNATAGKFGLRKLGTGPTDAAAGDKGVTVTTKGDVQGFSTVPARIPVGSDGTVLTADAAQATGVKWATPSSSGDVTGPSSSVDSEVAIFSGTTGKVIKRAAVTGIAKLASGVLSAVTTWAGAALTGTANRLAGFDGAGAATQYEPTGGVEISGSTVRRSALTGDVTAAAGSGSVTVDQARGLRETAGPTTLAMGAVADGQVLQRSGSTIIGVSLALAMTTMALSQDGYTTIDYAGPGDCNTDPTVAVGGVIS